ncbi:rubrerythrin-1 [Gottschalkia purinilytica]|uniref:Rubrerythrin-1 n=1 Tax=Gottschalkia purinilytica TaxID=1503 RepID=A0A0L0WAQ9_GOTPU|nr:rubrerythrin family protein [Gottschalkia purinilytica]KNF08576.1 rubrerythrin-1 [Gottschalkia purinilytica]
MNDMTAQNLRSAFGGESQAHMRYKAWGDKAKKEGFETVSTLFNAISYAEEIHAKSHFSALRDVKGDFLVASGAGFGVGSTSENLLAAAEGERYEVDQMYPAFIAVAELQGEKQALASMKHAIEAEKTHEKLYLEAKEHVDNGKDADFTNIHVCEICGYTSYGDMVEKCPICGVKNDKFRVF